VLGGSCAAYEYFTVSVWFKEKNRAEAERTDVSEKTKQLIPESILISFS